MALSYKNNSVFITCPDFSRQCNTLNFNG